jgi:hypothetical protein
MNNFTFGNEEGLNYYETICGGTGAGRDHPGESAGAPRQSFPWEMRGADACLRRIAQGATPSTAT